MTTTIIVRCTKNVRKYLHERIKKSLKMEYDSLKKKYPNKYLDVLDEQLDVIMLKIAKSLNCTVESTNEGYLFTEEWWRATITKNVTL